jgi:LuxR family maltose regulon positive regulatory protein
VGRCVTRSPAATGRAHADELRTSPATIAVFRASLAQARGDVEGTAAHARRAFDLAGPTDHLSRSGAAGFLALEAWARGDVSSALETFSEAVVSMHAGGGLIDELSVTVLLADMWLAACRPSRARRLYGMHCGWPRHMAVRWLLRPPRCTWESARSTARWASSRTPRGI